MVDICKICQERSEDYEDDSAGFPVCKCNRCMLDVTDVKEENDG